MAARIVAFFCAAAKVFSSHILVEAILLHQPVDEYFAHPDECYNPAHWLVSESGFEPAARG